MRGKRAAMRSGRSGRFRYRYQAVDDAGEREVERGRLERMHDEGRRPVELLAEQRDRAVRRLRDGAPEEVPENDPPDREPADRDRRDRERDERQRHDPRALVQVLARVLVHPLLAVEGHEHEPEAVERRHEHADQRAPVRVPCPFRPRSRATTR